jgi:tetratricopeptide (TPR) repeat protein
MIRLVMSLGLAALFPTLGAQEAELAPQPAPPAKICGGDDTTAPRATILDGYGKGGFPITTTVPQAQAFFDNGMQLGAAFAHKASVAAMKEAVRLDPGCAMCAWGEAWASGPNLNIRTQAADVPRLAALTMRAEQLAAKSGTDKERALIAALKLRYVAPKRGGKATDDIAFARAMDAVAKHYPDDLAIQTLSADAWLVAADERGALPNARMAMPILETVLARDPDYAPAIHFYIHATEFADVPGRATRYADALRTLAPKASHLVHMPSHTYYWIGRYQDAADANARAVAIGFDNAKRLGLSLPDGVWELPYHSHNVHFGVGGAMMSGDARTALMLSEPLVRVAAKREKGPLFSQFVAGMAYAAMGRHAEPAAVLALPEPKLPHVKAFWHYARGEAQARLGNAAGVRAEAAAIPWAISGDPKDRLTETGTRLVRVARLVLIGRAEMLDDRPARALVAYRHAARLEESRRVSDFADPPLWWYPVRRSVAETLLASGNPRAALAEIETSLRNRPHDPIALGIRARTQAALGNPTAASRDAKAALAGWRGERRAFASALS